MVSMTLLLLQSAGALLLLWGLARLAHWLWLYVWLPNRLSAQRLTGRYGAGSWALITGAGDGLGRAFARELARAGFHLILASRTLSKLEQLQTELQACGVQVRTIAVDLSDPTPAASEALAQAAQDVDLAVLVNCVGTTVHRRYADVSPAALQQLLAVNVGTTARVTHALLPQLLRHADITGHRAAVLTVGSIVGRFYWPGTQLYGACKAFVDHLTVPLGYEYADRLDVLSFQPTVMATAMAAGTEPAAITIAPEQAARAALAQLGHTHSAHGHWRHGLLAALLSVLPERLRNAALLKGALEMGAVEMAQGR
jgi:17beta-estradiol 17-dehydrogenase / very-long-chain 3-oxoacyl-CoA reductase